MHASDATAATLKDREPFDPRASQDTAVTIRKSLARHQEPPRSPRYTPAVNETTLPLTFESFLGTLAKENIHVGQRFHGDPPRRQPVHTFSGGAHRFTSDVVKKLGRIALRTLHENAADPP